MSLLLMPYGIFGSFASEKFPCKPVKDSISSNCVGERVGNLPWRSFSKMSLVLTPYGISRSSASQILKYGFELVIQFQTLFIFIVLSNSKICKKNINQYSFN
jgi:hypothetical protein